MTIKNRPIESYKTEFQRQDQQNFDKIIRKYFSFDTKILTQLYEILTETVENRIEMKNR